MKLLLLGANGRTGREILRLGLDRGDNISALVRCSDRLADITHDRLEVHVGNACDPDFLKTVAPGHDAVISVLGPRSPGRKASAVYADAGRALAEALPQSGVERLIVTSTALLFPKAGAMTAVLNVLVSGLVAQARRMENQIVASPLDWTIVRTGFLKDGPDEGASLEVNAPAKGGAVSRTALARFLLSEADHSRHVFSVVGIGGPSPRSAARKTAERQLRPL